MNQKEFEEIAGALRQEALKTSMHFLHANDADDVAQDTMLKLWAIHNDLHGKEHAMRLTATVAKHLTIDTLRHTQRTSTIMVTMDKRTGEDTTEWQPPDTKAISPHRKLEIKEDEQWLLERISALPDREMQVMRMRQTEMKSNDEIAAIMGITSASVATMLSSARRKIFEELKKRNRQ